MLDDFAVRSLSVVALLSVTLNFSCSFGEQVVSDGELDFCIVTPVVILQFESSAEVGPLTVNEFEGSAEVGAILVNEDINENNAAIFQSCNRET